MKRRRKADLAVVKTFPAPKVAEDPWTGLQMLKEFIAKVESGEIAPTTTLLFFLETDPNGRLRPHYWCQNVSVPNQIAFAALMTQMALEDWKGA